MKKLREKCKNKKGFTMVELIVVIVIILVLAAVLVPSLLKYVNKASEATCKSDAATILAELQADFAASQATEHTGLDEFDANGAITISGVTVTKLTPGPVTAAGVTDDAGQYAVSTAGATGTAVAYDEITSFGYNNGKYTAVWTLDGGWTVTAN